MIDEPGSYRFRVPDANPNTTLVVNGFELSACTADPVISLAAGVHRVEITSAGELASPSLEWVAPGGTEWTPVAPERLAQSRYLPGGLLTTHFDGVTDTTAPRFYEIDAGVDYRMHQFVLPRPYRTQWTGGLVPDVAGQYEISVQTDNELNLVVDGVQVLRNGPTPGQSVAVVQLDGSPVPISMEYLDRDGRSEVRLRWRLIGEEGPFTTIPSRNLVPWLETRTPPGC